MDAGVILEDYLKPLTKVSYDSENEQIPLIDSSAKAYDLDAITKRICGVFRGGGLLSSCDALVKKNNHYFLIEFKNQEETKIKENDIRKKAYDSFSTLRMVFNQNAGLDDLCTRTTLLVVYKDENLPGYTSLKEKMFELAKAKGDEPLNFNLSDFKGKMYSDIHTICKSKFMSQWYSRIWTD